MTSLLRARYNSCARNMARVTKKQIETVGHNEVVNIATKLATAAVEVIDEIDDTLCLLRLLHRQEPRVDIRSNVHVYCAHCDVRWPCQTIEVLGDL